MSDQPNRRAVCWARTPVLLSLMLLLVGACFFSTSAWSGEGDGFYTIMDASGRMIVVPKSDTKSSISSDTESNTRPNTKPNTGSSVAQLNQTTSRQPTAKQPANQPTSQPASPKPLTDRSANLVDRPARQLSIPAAAQVATQSQSQSAYFGTSSADTRNTNKLNTNNPDTNHLSANDLSPSNPNDTSPQRIDSATVGAQTASFQAKQSTVPAPDTVAVNTPATSQPAEKTNSNAPEVLVFTNETYVDSQVLMDKEFNPEGKQRFYAVPNGEGGVDYMERTSGVKVASDAPKPVLFSVSSGYKTYDKASAVDMLPMQCLSEKQQAQATAFKSKTLSLWPRQKTFTQRSQNIGTAVSFAYELIRLESPATELMLQSFATSSKRESYYWPLVVFLDANGCVLEAVSGFYQHKTPATWLQQSALKGNLLVPTGAVFMLLTPLEQTGELADTALDTHGALKLTALR